MICMHFYFLGGITTTSKVKDYTEGVIMHGFNTKEKVSCWNLAIAFDEVFVELLVYGAHFNFIFLPDVSNALFAVLAFWLPLKNSLFCFHK